MFLLYCFKIEKQPSSIPKRASALARTVNMALHRSGGGAIGRIWRHITAVKISGRVMTDMRVETRITPATSSGRFPYMRAKR